MNSSNSKLAAFLAYLLPILGWVYVFAFYRKDKFAMFHTKQAITIILMAIVGPIVWAVIAWVLALIPWIGGPLAISLFALVIALYIALLIVWLMGLLHAWRAKLKPLPLVGSWAARLPID